MHCKRCGYEARTKYELKRHLERKTPCVVIHEDIPISRLLQEIANEEDNKSYACKFCSRKFSHTSSMYRHQGSCSTRPKTTEDLEAEIMELRQQISNLTAQSNTETSIGSSSNSATINGNNNTVSQNITPHFNITINNFGNETYEHITEEFLLRCLNGDINGVKALIEKIHFSEDAPSNQNVRLKSLKRKQVEVMRNNKWVPKDANDAMETMITKSGRILNTKYYSSDMLQRDIEAFDDRLQKFLTTVVDKNSNQYFDLRRRILNLLIEHRNNEVV